MSVEHLSLPPGHLPPPPAYARPKLLGTYSHLPDRRIVPGDASMAYYRPAPLGADLTYGAKERIDRDESVEEHLDGLVESFRRIGRERPGGVVTWRGMLTRFMTAPFETEGWAMDAVALNGSVYLELYDPPEERAKRKPGLCRATWAMPTRHTRRILRATRRWTGPRAGREQSTRMCSGATDSSIVESSIGEIPVTIGGEVDCVDGTPNPGLSKCVELKTNKVINDERGDNIFHKKLLKHWAQSFLLGIPDRRGHPVLSAQLPDPAYSGYSRRTETGLASRAGAAFLVRCARDGDAEHTAERPAPA
ncbi:enzyme regulator [Trichosporon asahii var. asahii CBS 8904]|uniref:Decapping nuclease n=1 Tax=Trichosporon asahii var. asahii (strain CBS 8904) TaxID=1220162 RepID=K1VXL3_TRIAC|nr:enzyme regulator [Trichosporon asahii var. asahii CBS 8904]